MLPRSRRSSRVSTAAAALLPLLLASACAQGSEGAGAVRAEPGSTSAAPGEASASASASVVPSGSASASASPSATTSASVEPSGSATAPPSAVPSAKPSPKAGGGGSSAAGGSGGSADGGRPPASAPSFPVPASPGNATQLITVKANGSYATVTAWTKEASGWKSVISGNGRVGSKGVVDGATRKQSTYTTPSGTYTITEGFGVESGGTSMPYTKVNSTHWWVQDPESKFYNSMHTAEGADFPLVETGERGSERLINYPTQYAKALVINFNRWPAVPGRGAGIFLHVNGNGATAGCVSVPRATMDRIMSWIRPGAHPRIAIG